MLERMQNGMHYNSSYYAAYNARSDEIVSSTQGDDQRSQEENRCYFQSPSAGSTSVSGTCSRNSHEDFVYDDYEYVMALYKSSKESRQVQFN